MGLNASDSEQSKIPDGMVQLQNSDQLVRIQLQPPGKGDLIGIRLCA